MGKIQIASVGLLGFALTACIPFISSAAPFERNAVSGTFGTGGIGVELATQLNPNFTLRGGPQFLTWSADDTYSDVDYDVDIDAFNGNLFLDWYPTAGHFRLTGGMSAGSNEIDIDGRARNTVQIGNTVYTSAQVGTLNGKVDMQDFAGYLGLGYGNAFLGSDRWSFSVDAGVRLSGKPDVELTASGPIAANPLFQNDLERERQEIEDDLDFLQYYPLITFGVSYRF